MSGIKQRRMTNPVKCRPGLSVGECVPFYFCPRSVMLYLIHMGNHPELDYRGGQDSIVHLEADLREVVAWAEQQERRWAFTSSNAGSSYFEDYCDLESLDEIDWYAVIATSWSHCKEGKQAEFLIERSLPWSLFRRVGVRSRKIRQQAFDAIRASAHRPSVKIKRGWYY